MELRHLRYFVTVAQERNFTRAAEKLNVAQPPLSRQIQQLETELGTSLIERGTRPVDLTEMGKVLFDQAVQVLERVEEMTAIVERARRAKRHRLGIGFVGSTLYGRLPEIIRHYQAARPDVELALVELTSFEQVAALKDGRIDVGFGRIPFKDPAIKRQTIALENMIAALPAQHRRAGSDAALSLDDLAADPLIVYPRAPRPNYSDQVLKLYRERNLRPPLIHEVRELQTALALVATGLGICLVPATVEELRRDGVVYRKLDEPTAVSPIILSVRNGDGSREVATITRLIRQLYAAQRRTPAGAVRSGRTPL